MVFPQFGQVAISYLRSAYVNAIIIRSLLYTESTLFNNIFIVVRRSSFPCDLTPPTLAGYYKMTMSRIIKVNVLGRTGLEVRLMTSDAAEAAIQQSYADPFGGLVTDAHSGVVLNTLLPETEEINITEIYGGG